MNLIEKTTSNKLLYHLSPHKYESYEILIMGRNKVELPIKHSKLGRKKGRISRYQKGDTK